MKRKVEIIAGPIRVTATLNTTRLSRDEVERVRDDLASRIMQDIAFVPYIGQPISTQKVR